MKMELVYLFKNPIRSFLNIDPSEQDKEEPSAR